MFKAIDSLALRSYFLVPSSLCGKDTLAPELSTKLLVSAWFMMVSGPASLYFSMLWLTFVFNCLKGYTLVCILVSRWCSVYLRCIISVSKHHRCCFQFRDLNLCSDYGFVFISNLHCGIRCKMHKSGP